MEQIIAKFLFYFGDVYGMDWKDVEHMMRLTSDEIDICKKIVEEYNNARK
jgi:hypothetical protein